jgi:hypothetical protein
MRRSGNKRLWNGLTLNGVSDNILKLRWNSGCSYSPPKRRSDVIKPTKTLYNSESEAIPSEVSIVLNASKEVQPEDCPWVQVGKLYLSVTITGEESWLPLLARLHKSGYKEFSVFSGRHGDIPNKVDREGTTQGVFDEKHIEQDEVVKQKALKLKELENITIEIVDTRAGEKNQKQWLIKNAKQRFQTNTPVIFAWCYSLFTMSEFHRKTVDLKLTTAEEMTAYSKAQSEEISKSISEIVKTNFAWAMRDDQSARRPIGSAATARKASSQSGEALYAPTEAPTAFADKSAG